MNYSVTFVWTKARECPAYLPAGFQNTPLNCYQAIRRELLLKKGVHLPVPDSKAWSCSILSEEDLTLEVAFFSCLEIEAFTKQMNEALVPLFADRIEVKPSRAGRLGVVLSN